MYNPHRAQDVGGFGRYQCFLVFLSYFASMQCSLNHFGPIFSAYQPKFACLDGFVK